MIKTKDVLEKTSSGVSLVAGIAFGLAILTTCTCIIVDNVRKLIPSRRKHVCVGVMVEPVPAKNEEAKANKPKKAPKAKADPEKKESEE